MDEVSFFQQLQAINRQANFNGAWAIVDRTGVRFQDQSGWANFKTKEPFTPDTITAIGSLTKQFTAIAILQLFEHHQLKLEDHLSRYLPNYTYGDKITIEQLLTMTSGVPDYTDLIANSLIQSLKAQHRAPTDIQLKVDQTLGKDISMTEILTLINNRPLTFVPGSQFAYSNTNYALLTQIIKNVSGISYDQYIHENLLIPLGLTHTLLGTNNSQAQSYQYHNQEIILVGKGDHQLGDGCIVMNLTDLIKYSQAVINQRLLKPKTWRLAFDLKFGKYGMGWMKINSWFWHSGQILGYWSDFFLTPDHQTAMVWLYNISPSGDAEKQWLNATDTWRESYLSWLNQ